MQTANFGILAIYRSPSGNIIKFIDELNIVISNIIKSYKNIPLILIGDININTLDTTNSTAIYLDLLTAFGFTQYINRPTRPKSNTSIDHILINDYNKHYVQRTAVIDSLITDHYPLFLKLNNRSISKKDTKSNNILYKYVDYNKLSLILY
ncbi:otoferlin-like [Aphis craccivora]|uniref:Otoferlin-like n=1 Tax=Aphis craccivora TaxID=307492 RepID=A0A6G0VQJ1_APHCR|nr:otoferlin-like [Aphis craccivora]